MTDELLKPEVQVTQDQAANMMLARNPNLSYLASVTGLSGDSLALLTRSRALHFRDTGEPESPYAKNYKAFYDKSTVPLEKVLEEMRNNAYQAILMHNAGYYGGALSAAIRFLSIPHGVMDLAAFCMDENQFDAYVRYCRKIRFDAERKQQ